MLTPRFLARAPEPIVALYSQLETEILLDIVARIGRIAKASSINPARIYYSELSAFNKAAAETIARHLRISTPELIKVVNDSVIHSLRQEDKIYQAMARSGALDKYVALRNSAVMQETMQPTIEILARDFGARIRQTQAAAGQLLMQQISQVITAKEQAYFDFPSYMSKTIRKLGHLGITVIETDGRPLSMESFARREIITGINTAAAQASIARADEVGNDLVCTSQHYGARPSHAEWQGKIFSLSGTSAKYPDFRASTGYGTITGLCGINCRHSFYPFFKGYSEPEKPLDAERNAKMYELEQMQRSNERNIRTWKRINQMENAQELDSTYSAMKVREWQAKNRELIESEPWLSRDYGREQIG